MREPNNKSLTYIYSTIAWHMEQWQPINKSIYLDQGLLRWWVGEQLSLTLKVPVTAIDALQHFETG